MTTPRLPVDPGLLVRFRGAAGEIRWRTVRPTTRPTPAGGSASTMVRVAHLHDEDARVESRRSKTGVEFTVDSGPVGALVLVAECIDRGLPAGLGQHGAKALPEFPMGAIEAVWGTVPPRVDGPLTFHDLVQLARYALV